MKRTVAIAMSVIMIVATSITALADSVKVALLELICDQSFTESEVDQTAKIDLEFTYTADGQATTVDAPHKYITLESSSDAIVLNEVVVKSVNGNGTEYYDKDSDIVDDVDTNPWPAYIDSDGKDISGGKFLVETYVDETRKTDFESVVLTATYTIPANTPSGEYTITATADATDYSEADYADVTADYTLVIAEKVVEPECDHKNATLNYDKNSGLYTKTCECGFSEDFEPIVSDEKIDIPFTATTLDLKDSIGLIYYIAASKVADADYFYLNVNHKVSDGTNTSKNDKNYEGTYSSGYGGEYKFIYPDVSAKEMKDIIYATLYVIKDGFIYSTESVTFNPYDYAARILSDSKYAANLKTLIVDMLNYGAEAQKQFSYNTDNLANAGLTEEQKEMGTSAIPTMKDALNYGDNTMTVVHSIPTVSLSSRVEIVYYVKDPTSAVTDVNSLSLVVEAAGTKTVIPWSDFEYNSKYKEYKASFAGLSAKQMGAVAEFTMYENYGTDNQKALSSTMLYSIESYAATRTASQGQLYNTSIAMIRYGQSALNYFGA